MIFYCLVGNLTAQPKYTARQAVYDLGLVSIGDPFLANRNSALLVKMNQYQIGLGFDLTKPVRSLISITLPLQHNLALATTWDRWLKQDLLRTPTRVTNYTEHDNQFTFSLAHPLAKGITIGHQVNTRTLTQSDALIWDVHIVSTDSLLDKDSYLWEGAYQIGVCWEVSDRIRLGLLSPPVIYASFLETRVARFETKLDKSVTFWGERAGQANLPELAIEYVPSGAHSLVAALGKEANRAFFHGAAKSTLWNRITLAIGCDWRYDTQNQFLVGAGSYLGGFHIFYSYNFGQKLHQLALSFSPQQEKQLIQLSELEQKYYDVYLYKLDSYYHCVFIVGVIKNLTHEKVSLHLELAGKAIEQVRESHTLSPQTEWKFSFNLPSVKNQSSNLTTACQLRIIAFQRAKQIIVKSFPIQIYDLHQWNGELEDLVYFVQPNNQVVYQLARKFTQELSRPLNVIQLSETIFSYISQNFQYLSDPTLNTTDYVQLPQESLMQRSGDCEDLSVLYCSLLGALGIQTALVEIKYPENKDAHIFVLVNTGLKPENFNFIQQNPNRFVFKKNPQGSFNAWLPVELTLVGQPFDKAWEKAAEEYYCQAILKGGLAEGWVKVVDVF